MDSVGAEHGHFLEDTPRNVEQQFNSAAVVGLAHVGFEGSPEVPLEIKFIPPPHFTHPLSVFGLSKSDLRQLESFIHKEGEADCESGLWNPRHLFWDSLLGHSLFPKLIESFVRDSLGFWQSGEKSAQRLLCVLQSAAMCLSGLLKAAPGLSLLYSL